MIGTSEVTEFADATREVVSAILTTPFNDVSAAQFNRNLKGLKAANKLLAMAIKDAIARLPAKPSH